MDTQQQNVGQNSVVRLQGFLGRLAEVMGDAKAHVEQPLDPGHWDGDTWIDEETADDRAFIVLDELIGELVAACLGMCDTPGMMPADFAEYVQVMARTQLADMPAVSPTNLRVLDFVARCELAADDEPQTPAAVAQFNRLQWMMQLPPEDYLASLEAQTDDGRPRVLWAIHPDNWDFEKGCPKSNGNGSCNGNGHSNGAA